MQTRILPRPEPRRGRRLVRSGVGLLLGSVVCLTLVDPERTLFLLALVLTALLLVARPHWGVLAIFGIVMFRFHPVRLGPLTTAELVAVPLLVPLGLAMVRDRDVWVWRIPEFRIALGIGGVLVASTVWSLLMHPVPPIEAVRGPWSTLSLFGQQLVFLVFAAYFIRTPRQAAWAMVVVLLLALTAAFDSLQSVDWEPGAARVRASAGWVANPNRLGFFCVWATALAWALRFKAPRRWWRPLTLVPLFALPPVALLTGSRSALLQLALLAGLIILEQRRWSPTQRMRAVGFLVVLALVVLAVTPAAMMTRVSHYSGPSVDYRLRTYGTALTMAAEHPFLGVGPGNFHWRNEVMTGVAYSSHQSYLWALVSGGPLLLLLYLLLFRRAYRTLRQVEQRGPRDLEWAATALRFQLLVFVAFSFFADLWLTHPLYLLLGLTLAVSRMAGTAAVATRPVTAYRAAMPTLAGRGAW